MFPEAGGDILEGAIGTSAVHPLIGAWGVEGTEMAEIRSHFDIIKMPLVDERRDCCASSVSASLQIVVMVLDVFRKRINDRRVGIAPINPTQVMVSSVSRISADSASAVNSFLLSAHRN